jgi:hypothetical protein
LNFCRYCGKQLKSIEVSIFDVHPAVNSEDEIEYHKVLKEFVRRRDNDIR